MIRIVLVAIAIAIPVSPAAAQSPWSLEGTVGVVSDYRYRGYSLSDSDPALQAGLTLSHSSGFYGDVFISSIDEYGVGADGDGADLEATGSIGWAGTLGGFDVDAAVSAYRYPDGDDVDYIEVPVQIGQTLGALTWTVGVAYAPAQDALSDDDNRYGWAGLRYAPDGWPISLSGILGYEDGAFAPDGKSDWAASAEYDVGPATLALTWIDSDEDAGALVAAAFVKF